VSGALLSSNEWIDLANRVVEAVDRDRRWNTMAGDEHWQLVLVRVHAWAEHLEDLGVRADHPTRDRLDDLRKTIALGLNRRFRARLVG
jgi:hypothetical protein